MSRTRIAAPLLRSPARAAPAPGARAYSAPRAIRSVAVFGSGLMGSGIVQSVAAKGIPVRMVDVAEEATARGLDMVRTSLARVAKRAHPDDPARQKEEVDRTMANISASTDAGKAAEGVDLAVEAIVENLGMKRKLFRALDEAAPSHAIFASNTSSLRILDIAEGVSSARRSQFGGLHFFNPVPVMKLVEVIGTAETSPNSLRALVAFVKTLGKVPVECADTPGFVVNRLLVPYIFEAVRLVERGDANFADVDVAMKLGSGVPMGPFELADYIGLDTLVYIMEGWHKHGQGIAGTALTQPSPLLDALVAEGSLGRKNGRGFYSYGGAGKELVPNEGSAALAKFLKR
ncbi:mitochondrial hydroxyacyl-coenzyme A dehydrogenase [Hyaloraphidium curvatum]|nr:mitochondrial hydroxyacyl-coenzyme A dehydrogenase [Hyaloraphidium curvatum]